MRTFYWQGASTHTVRRFLQTSVAITDRIHELTAQAVKILCALQAEGPILGIDAGQGIWHFTIWVDKMKLAQLLKDSDFNGRYNTWRSAREVLNTHIAGGERVLDLGCANGFLLASLLLWHSRGFIPFGMDIDPARIQVACRLLGAFAGNFYHHNFFDLEWPVSEADIIIAPWQFSSQFMETCLKCAARVIFTAYDDRLAGGLDVVQECRSAGLEILKVDIVPGITQAVSIRGWRNSPGPSRLLKKYSQCTAEMC